MKILKKILLFILHACFLIIACVFACIFRFKKRKWLIFGATPLINNKYWKEAISADYPKALTLMRAPVGIYGKKSFDLYFEDFFPKFFIFSIFKRFSVLIGGYLSFLYVLRKAKVLHMHFDGFLFPVSYFGLLEILIFKLARVQTIIIPYGGDAYAYSAVEDLSLRHTLLTNYPMAGRRDAFIQRRIKWMGRFGDIVLAGAQTEGFGYWNVGPAQYILINPDICPIKTHYSTYDGKNGPVKIVHSPNHRAIKGTEFLIHAIENLKKEGLLVEFYLLEGVPNEKVIETLSGADILVDQLGMYFYALSGMEGMACGLPTLTNMNSPNYRSFFNRYSYLQECPILSTSREEVEAHLRILIRHPKLREELGRAGRAYVEKYHSYETARYIFGSIYDKILHGKDVDLMSLFHPLLSPYNKSKPCVQHPLIEGKLPRHYCEENERAA